MKVIDLLNKIANGEEAPNKISVVWAGARVHDLYQYNDYIKWYETLDETTLMTIDDSDDLYCEVEIIEEEKEIEKIMGIDTRETRKCIMLFQDKINELIYEINKLKENK